MTQTPAKKEKQNLALPERKSGKQKKFKSPLLKINEKRALLFFQTLGDWWREKKGFYAGQIQPQLVWLPDGIRDNPIKLGDWFFCVALPMRGGINSDDAFRFMYELYADRSDLFDPYITMHLKPEEIALATEKVAARIHPGGSQGEKKKGTFSYQSYQHEKIWIYNAKMLVEHWGGDLRNIFDGALDFEKAFARVDHKRSAKGFRGMRRKIFSLMTMWLMEFKLILEFDLPLIIDFHAIRELLSHEILEVEFKELGPGKPKNKERLRPESLWKLPSIHITEGFVDQVILWSLAFLKKHRKVLKQYDVAHGKWFLSRVLCAAYYGNKSFEQKHEDGIRRGLTERVVADEELKNPRNWPMRYRDPCRLCPVEKTCKARFPQGPYFDWGAMVKAGRHLDFPLRRQRQELPFIRREMPNFFGKKNGRHYLKAPLNGASAEEEASLQLTLGFTEKT